MANERDYYDTYDIMFKCGCGRDRAQATIRAIKESVGGGKLGKGKVLKTEYEAWKNAVTVVIVNVAP